MYITLTFPLPISKSYILSFIFLFFPCRCGSRTNAVRNDAWNNSPPWVCAHTSLPTHVNWGTSHWVWRMAMVSSQGTTGSLVNSSQATSDHSSPWDIHTVSTLHYTILQYNTLTHTLGSLLLCVFNILHFNFPNDSSPNILISLSFPSGSRHGAAPAPWGSYGWSRIPRDAPHGRDDGGGFSPTPSNDLPLRWRLSPRRWVTSRGLG